MASFGTGKVAGANVSVARGVIVGRAVGSGTVTLGTGVRSVMLPPQALRAKSRHDHKIRTVLLVRVIHTSPLYWDGMQPGQKPGGNDVYDDITEDNKESHETEVYLAAVHPGRTRIVKRLQ